MQPFFMHITSIRTAGLIAAGPSRQNLPRRCVGTMKRSEEHREYYLGGYHLHDLKSQAPAIRLAYLYK